MSTLTKYTFDEAIPEYVRSVIERKEPIERIMRVSDGTFIYRMLVEDGHVSLLAKTIVW